MKSLTISQKKALNAIRDGALRKDENGYYFSVPTDTRRSGRYNIKAITLNQLVTLGLITPDLIPSC